MPEPWLKKAEVAAELRVSIRTVERLKLPCTKVGGQNRYLMSEVLACLQNPDDVQDNVTPLRPHPGGRAA
jgi:hypothetical protein